MLIDPTAPILDERKKLEQVQSQVRPTTRCGIACNIAVGTFWITHAILCSTCSPAPACVPPQVEKTRNLNKILHGDIRNLDKLLEEAQEAAARKHTVHRADLPSHISTSMQASSDSTPAFRGRTSKIHLK